MAFAGSLLGPSSRAALAQSHYWSENFGNESILLNGAVIGSVTDPGAVFYNPARLIHQKDLALLSGAKVYEWTRTRVDNPLRPGDNLENSGFRGVPSFVVGSFSIPGLDGHQFAYGVLTRHRSRVRFSYREEGGLLLPDIEDLDLFVGFTDFETEFRDDWFGLSWAHPVSEGFSVGASLFYFDRAFARTARVDLRGIDVVGDAATVQVERSYQVKDKGLVGKAGVAWQRGRASAGLSVTLPYWAFADKGFVRFDDFTLGLPDSTGTRVSRLQSLEQGGLPVEWKTPWSVGLGFGWASGDWQFHSAAEYFAAVPVHVVLETDPGSGGMSAGLPIEYTVLDQRKAVFNVGAGVRWDGSDHLSLFGSVATNGSAAPDSLVEFTALDTLVYQTTLETDYVLVGGGVSVSTPWADFTLGATWQGGRDDVARAVQAPSPTPGEEDDDPVVRLDQWRFLAGFSIPMVDDLLGGVVGR
ncbi:MAG: hypothetical protein P8188_13185 [Gemmatimonadota bacterium]